MAGYNPGYVFFTHAHDPVAEGINWFERFGRGRNLRVHHTGIVTGTNEVVEAHWRNGVQWARLADYLDITETLIVFRRPQGWTAELGARITAAAVSRVGSAYDKGLILAQLMSNTLIGWLLNVWFRGGPERWVSARLDRRQAFICSELSAWALNEQAEFRGKGVLGLPLDTISPQELFDDQYVFEP
jgi:hypothetical protein